MQEEAQKIELELPEGEVDIHAADVDDSIKEEKVEISIDSSFIFQLNSDSMENHILACVN